MPLCDIFCQREPTPDQEVKVDIPEELRKWLVDDWDFVTRQKQVSHIKCNFCVHKCGITVLVLVYSVTLSVRLC